jgi:hypothetical protein
LGTQYAVRVTYERSMVSEAARRYAMRAFGWIGPLALLMVLFALVNQLRSGDRSWFVGMLGAVLILALAVGLGAFLVPYRRAMSKYEAMSSRSAEFIFRETGFAMRSELGAAEVGWSTVERVVRATRVWLFVLRGASYLTLPVVEVPEEVRGFIEEQVRKHGGRVG